MKGNLTIEAAYIFPFCFFVLGLVSFLGIFLYNQAVLEMTGYECILQTVEERELKEDDLKGQLLRRAKQAAEDRTFGVEGLQVNLKVTKTKIASNYKGTQSVIGVPINVDAVYERTSPELTLRLIKGIGENANE